MSGHLLSKSSFIVGNQCHKALYLSKRLPELKDPVGVFQQSIFDRGHQVGKIAQNLFTNGINLQCENSSGIQDSIKKMNELINSSNVVIYEAPFLFNKTLAILDILVCSEGKWYAYEVKSSTEITETFLLDSALQYYVIKNSGLKLEDFSIVYINNKYVRKCKIELDLLFNIESVKEKIITKQPNIANQIESFKQLLKENEAPNIDIGAHCDTPYTCSFHGNCWQHIPKYSIFDIARLSIKKKFELYNEGIINLNEVPDNFPLNQNQRDQINCEVNKTRLIDVKKIRNFIKDLNYPLYFLDFETYQAAIPLFDNSRPYQQIVFQYSLHYLESNSSELKHYNFLSEADENIDPRIQFIESLIRDLKKDGDILVYNIAFERTRLLELAKDFPYLKDQINEIIKRLKDLMIPFQNRFYYTPEMKGSYSIKYVLPALFPDLTYSDLEIKEGGTASSSFLNLYKETNQEEANKIRQNLLKYCERDTFAMVKIFEVLEKV